MSTSWIVKVNFLILALLVVLFVIYKLETGAFDRGLGAFFGMGPEAPPRKGTVVKGTTLNWCETRVKALEKIDGPRVMQRDMEWFWQNQKQKRVQLDPVSVEKWLGHHCEVEILPMPKSHLGAANFRPAWRVEFVKGPPVVLKRSDSGIFKWKEHTFRSHDLSKGLKKVKNWGLKKAQ